MTTRDAGRKRTEANMITGPAWMLDGRTFASANRRALGVAVVRALPASRAACLRRGRHPVGSERLQRQTTGCRALHQLRGF
jgi:hypothetical protein